MVLLAAAEDPVLSSRRVACRSDVVACPVRGRLLFVEENDPNALTAERANNTVAIHESAYMMFVGITRCLCLGCLFFGHHQTVVTKKNKYMTGDPKRVNLPKITIFDKGTWWKRKLWRSFWCYYRNKAINCQFVTAWLRVAIPVLLRVVEKLWTIFSPKLWFTNSVLCDPFGITSHKCSEMREVVKFETLIVRMTR